MMSAPTTPEAVRADTPMPMSPTKLAPRPSQFTVDEQYKYALWNVIHSRQEKLIAAYGGVDAFTPGFVSDMRNLAKSVSGWDGTAVVMSPHGMPAKTVRQPKKMPMPTAAPAPEVEKVEKAVKVQCAATNKDGKQCSKGVSGKSTTRAYCATHAAVWDIQMTSIQAKVDVDQTTVPSTLDPALSSDSAQEEEEVEVDQAQPVAAAVVAQEKQPLAATARPAPRKVRKAAAVQPSK